MKPKLIMLNGPLGIGKSTLATRYAEDHPVTLNLDIDNVWSMLGKWREEKEVSSPLAKKIALSMARVALENGHDVIVPQILQDTELADNFKRLAEEVGAEYFEILLHVEKEEAIKRFVERGKSQGHPTGFRAGGIIDTGGREKKLAEMYEHKMQVAEARPNTIFLTPRLHDIDNTYTDLLNHVSPSH